MTTSEQPYAYALRRDGRRIVVTDGPGESPGTLQVRADLHGTFDIAPRWDTEHLYFTTADGERCPVRFVDPEQR